MLGITALYIALQVVAQGILGSGLAQATVSPLADAAGASLGGWARALLLAGATVSMFGYIGGDDVVDAADALRLGARRLSAAGAGGPSSRPPRAAGRDPRAIVARVRARDLRHVREAGHPRERRPPSRSISAARSRRGGSGSWAWPDRGWRLECRSALVAPWLACVVIIWLLTGLTRNEWLAFGACLAAASLLYAVIRAARQGHDHDTVVGR